MGRYEPPRQMAKPAPKQPTRRRIGGKSIVAGLGSMLATITTAGVLAVGPSINELNSLEEKIREPAPHVITVEATRLPPEYGIPIHPPMKEALDVTQGTQPLADGMYLDLSTISHGRVPEVLSTLKPAGLAIIVEPVGHDQDRLLVRYKEGEQHDIVRRFQALYPTSTPMVMEKRDGKDRFFKYEQRRYGSLEQECKRANGDITKMPFYEEVHNTALTLIKEDGFGKYGTKHEIEKALYAIIWTESSGKEDAVSNMGAIGLMQVMPYTARTIDPHVQDLFNPRDNIRIGAKIWSEHVETVTRKTRLRHIEDILPKSGAGYNAGTRHLLDVLRGREPYDETMKWMKNSRKNYRVMTRYTG